MQIWIWFLQLFFWKSLNCDKWTSLWWFMGLNYSVYMSIKMISILSEEFLESALFIEVIAKKVLLCVFIIMVHWFGQTCLFPLHDDPSPWQLLTDYHSNSLLMSQNLQTFTFLPFSVYLSLSQLSISLVFVTACWDKIFITSRKDTLFFLDLCLRHT